MTESSRSLPTHAESLRSIQTQTPIQVAIFTRCAGGGLMSQISFDADAQRSAAVLTVHS